MADARHDELAVESAKQDGFAEEEDLEAQLAYENLKKRREARRRKRIVVGILVAAVALAAGAYFFVRQAQEAAEAELALDPLSLTTSVYRGDFTTDVVANGAAEPLQSTVVTPEVDGIIENLQVDVGQQVNEGDVLFTVKNDEYDKQVREAQDKVDSAARTRDRAWQQVGKANAAVDDAYNARQAAWDAFNDYQNRLAAGEVDESEEVVEYNESSLNEAISLAEDARDQAYDAADDAEVALAEATTALDDAKAEADKRTVTAPVSGTIIQMSAKEGARTSGSGSEGGTSGSASREELMQIVDLSQMKVTVQVNEADVSAIRVGQAATATFSALPDVVLDAQVTRIASVASGDASGGGVVTYAVDLLIPKPDEALRPGMTANVTITTQSVPDTLIVSAASVGEDERGAYVIVVDDAEKGQTHRVDVEVVAQNGSDAAIEADLEDGDVVLLDPTAGEALGGEDLGDTDLGDDADGADDLDLDVDDASAEADADAQKA